MSDKREQSKEKSETKRAAIQKINELHSGMFQELMNVKDEVVRCTICNHLVKIFPERGSFVNNIEEHAKSHKGKTSLKRQATACAFFKPPKVKRLIDNHRAPR